MGDNALIDVFCSLVELQNNNCEESKGQCIKDIEKLLDSVKDNVPIDAESVIQTAIAMMACQNLFKE